MNILSDFKELFESYEKKYKHQGAFKNLKMVKNASGEKEPVFYIGGPGLIVAITMAVVTLLSVYILSLPFKWYIWIPYILMIFFMMRIAMKLDKARQIRFMVYYMLSYALKFVEKAEEIEDKDEKSKYIDKAVEYLERANTWVDEAPIGMQIEVLKSSK